MILGYLSEPNIIISFLTGGGESEYEKELRQQQQTGVLE